MKLALYHGRLNPDTGGTDVEGNPVDDWGAVAAEREEAEAGN